MMMMMTIMKFCAGQTDALRSARTELEGGDVVSKVISAANQMVYSNVISLKAGNEKNYRLSTLVNNEISIQSFTQYQYRLVDLNGRTLKTGILPAGVQTIPVSHLSAGMYVLQLIDQNTLYAERIIKQ